MRNACAFVLCAVLLSGCATTRQANFQAAGMHAVTPFGVIGVGYIKYGREGQESPAPQIASRDELVKALPAVVEVEKRAEVVRNKLQILAFTGAMPQSIAEEIKGLYDVYYVWHKAATLALSRGDFAQYEKFLEAARVELNKMEKLLAAKET